MKILLVTGDLPWPATSGGRLRDQLLYRAAAAVGDVHLLSFPFRGYDPSAVPSGALVHPMPWDPSFKSRLTTRLRATMHGRLVFQQHLLQHGSMRLLTATIDSLQPDAVILASPLFQPFAIEAAAGGRPVFVDMTDLRSRLVEQQIREVRRPARWMRAVMDAVAVRRAEASLVGAVREVWFAERSDARIYERRSGARTRVIPNTVDVEAYAEWRRVSALPHHFGFVGSFDYAPNLAAAERLLVRILPLLRRRVPDASLVLIGRSPPRSLVSSSERAEGAELFANDPAPMRRLSESGLLVAPIQTGAGTKFKLVEAASAAVPIITSPVGLAGLSFRDGEEVLVAVTDEDFVMAIERLWRDPAAARRLAQRALVRVAQHNDHRVSIAAVRDALSSADHVTSASTVPTPGRG
jgi:glycosyltransferase involved in cell wall biosynthesis